MGVNLDSRHLKAVILAFPELLSRCPPSAELAILLKGTRLADKVWFRRVRPGYDWDILLHPLNEACKAYYKPVLELRPLSDRISFRIQNFFGRNQQQIPEVDLGIDKSFALPRR